MGTQNDKNRLIWIYMGFAKNRQNPCYHCKRESPATILSLGLSCTSRPLVVPIELY